MNNKDTANPFFSAKELIPVIFSLAQKNLPSGMSKIFKGISDLDEDYGKLSCPLDLKESLVKEVLEFFNLDNNLDRSLLLEKIADTDKINTVLYSLSENISRQWNKELTFKSSGSTGKASKHIYSLEVLMDEAKCLSPYFQESQRIISLVPPHHIFGFVFSVLLPKALKIPVVHLAPLPVLAFFKKLQSNDLVLAFPFFWQSSLLMLNNKDSACFLPNKVRGISSTGPCPPEVIKGLLNLPTGQSLSSMTEIYGSTETSAMGLRQNTDKAYTLLPYWKRVRTDTEDYILRTNDKKAVKQAVPDFIDWESKQSFYPTGRKDRAVQVGGENIYPEKITELIKKHPKVLDATVRLMKPEEGVRLKAFVVPKDYQNNCPEKNQAFILELRNWLKSRSKAAEMPKSISLGQSLPRNSMGKLKDWQI